jgi:bacteriocin-like protein
MKTLELNVEAQIEVLNITELSTVKGGKRESRTRGLALGLDWD